MLDEPVATLNSGFNGPYCFEYDREAMKRRHSPLCTEIMMKGYRCMKKSQGNRYQCQYLIDALNKCRHPDAVPIKRKPTI